MKGPLQNSHNLLDYMGTFKKIVSNTSHLLTLKALPRQLVAMETAIIQSLRSRMLTSVNRFFFISLLMVSMYLNFGLPLGPMPLIYCYSELLYRNNLSESSCNLFTLLLYHVYVVYLFGFMLFKSNLNI